MNIHTIDTLLARQMVEASALRGASIIGQPGGWSVMLKIGMTEKPLGTQRTDKPRTWRSLDSCMAYLREELRIVRVDGVDASQYSISSVHVPRRADSAARMKAAHAAAAYDLWFRQQVQESLDDPRPSIPHAAVMADVQAVIDAAKAKKKKLDAGRSRP